MVVVDSGTATLVDGVQQFLKTAYDVPGVYVVILGGLTDVGMSAPPDALNFLVEQTPVEVAYQWATCSIDLLFGTANAAVAWHDTSGWVSPRIVNTHTLDVSLTATSWAGDVEWVLVKVQ